MDGGIADLRGLFETSVLKKGGRRVGDTDKKVKSAPGNLRKALKWEEPDYLEDGDELWS